MKAFLWSTPLRKSITSFCAMLVAIFGVITKGPEAMDTWDDQGLPTAATRGWVRQRTAQLKDIQLDIANGKLESAQRDRDKLELDYLKAGSQEEKVLNQQAQRRTQETVEKLRDQINSIQRSR